MTLNVSFRAAPPIAIAMLQGVLNSTSQQALKQQLEPVLGNGQFNTIQLDFASVQSIEPASSGMLMMLSHTAKAKNKVIAVLNANASVLATMHKANLGKVLKIS
jgi:anti-anti-sigma factor